jgi:two-component sensor histidine kinase
MAPTTLVLVPRELATNSLEYGVLSCETGTLNVSCSQHDERELELVWTERGSPPVVAPEVAGYGSKLTSKVTQAERDGSIEREWSPEGAVVTIKIKKACLAH